MVVIHERCLVLGSRSGYFDCIQKAVLSAWAVWNPLPSWGSPSERYQPNSCLSRTAPSVLNLRNLLFPSRRCAPAGTTLSPVHLTTLSRAQGFPNMWTLGKRDFLQNTKARRTQSGFLSVVTEAQIISPCFRKAALQADFALSLKSPWSTSHLAIVVTAGCLPDLWCQFPPSPPFLSCNHLFVDTARDVDTTEQCSHLQ